MRKSWLTLQSTLNLVNVETGPYLVQIGPPKGLHLVFLRNRIHAYM